MSDNHDVSAIWKFPLSLDNHQYVRMPFDAIPLYVTKQDDLPVLYAICCTDPSHLTKPFDIYCVGTGHEKPDSFFRKAKSLGVTTHYNDQYFFHWFVS